MPSSPAIDVGSLLARRATITPDRPALTFAGHTLTYRELGSRVRRLATALRAGGVKAGDRVAYVGANHPSFLETFAAAASLGAIFVPLNARLTAHELGVILADAEAFTLVSDADRVPVVEALRPTSKLRWCLALGDAPPGAGWSSYETVLGSAAELAVPTAPAAGDVAVIMYTSGTTGRSKGAMLTHDNIFWHHVNLTHALDVSSEDVTLVVAPLFHIGGLNICTLNTLFKAGHVILMPAFQPTEALALIDRYRVTTMFGVPAMFNFMAQDATFATTDLTSIRYLLCGGAPVPEALIRTYQARGVSFAQVYGLTETAPVVLGLGVDQIDSRPGSAGFHEMLLCEVRLVNEQGQPVKTGEPGEVCIRGPQVMKGYWRNPEATAAVFDADGFFHSGDIGYEDKDGFVYLIDRSKDLVISGGENVYPAEVETVIYDHPAVAECAVIGTPHERWGEAVTAIVVLKPNTGLGLEELRTFARERLAGFKLPLRLEELPSLPRTPSGKVLKYQLRETFGGARKS